MLFLSGKKFHISAISKDYTNTSFQRKTQLNSQIVAHVNGDSACVNQGSAQYKIIYQIKGKNIKRKQKIGRRSFIMRSKIIRLWAGHGNALFQGSVSGSLDNREAGFNSFQFFTGFL